MVGRPLAAAVAVRARGAAAAVAVRARRASAAVLVRARGAVAAAVSIRAWGAIAVRDRGAVAAAAVTARGWGLGAAARGWRGGDPGAAGEAHHGGGEASLRAVGHGGGGSADPGGGIWVVTPPRKGCVGDSDWGPGPWRGRVKGGEVFSEDRRSRFEMVVIIGLHGPYEGLLGWALLLFLSQAWALFTYNIMKYVLKIYIPF